MTCPRCGNTELAQRTERDSGVRLDVCPRCSGIWFDADELEQVLCVAAKDLQPPRRSLERTSPCPKCAQLMTAFHYPQTLVVVDMCRTCRGIWLGGRELREIRVIRGALRRRHRLEEYAPLPGIKGGLLRFVNWAIVQLNPWS